MHAHTVARGDERNRDHGMPGMGTDRKRSPWLTRCAVLRSNHPNNDESSVEPTIALDWRFLAFWWRQRLFCDSLGMTLFPVLPTGSGPIMKQFLSKNLDTRPVVMMVWPVMSFAEYGLDMTTDLFLIMNAMELQGSHHKKCPRGIAVVLLTRTGEFNSGISITQCNEVRRSSHQK
jgi:hypothetical protein